MRASRSYHPTFPRDELVLGLAVSDCRSDSSWLTWSCKLRSWRRCRARMTVAARSTTSSPVFIPEGISVMIWSCCCGGGDEADFTTVCMTSVTTVATSSELADRVVWGSLRVWTMELKASATSEFWVTPSMTGMQLPFHGSDGTLYRGAESE